MIGLIVIVFGFIVCAAYVICLGLDAIRGKK